MRSVIRLIVAPCIFLLLCGCTSKVQLMSAEAKRSGDRYLVSVRLSDQSFRTIRDNESTLWIYLIDCQSPREPYVMEAYVNGQLLNETKWSLTKEMVATATVPTAVVDTQGKRCVFVDGGNMIGRTFKSSVVGLKVS